MDGPDEIIHQSTRLRIAATLNALPVGEMLEFSRLKAIMNATDGNLGAHLTALENAGYVEVTKDFVGKKPRTRITLSAEGRKAFRRHVAYLRALIDGEPGSGRRD
ncbi:MAG TPA: transcriptional regulator [Caulobacteraceae bacterium]|jgi:DNA-binding transcriptional ArsR family regulator|nr:transcriptional regulator [Caulobacteraceae bacterium]